jgi:hypothetical protein
MGAYSARFVNLTFATGDRAAVLLPVQAKEGAAGQDNFDLAFKEKRHDPLVNFAAKVPCAIALGAD